MGFDTRYWGPSAWQLFHLIAFKSEHPDDVLNQMKDVLPCKFCRASTTEFVKEHPLHPEGSGKLRGDPGKWLYDIHNMVNHKLRTQCKDDPAVIHPGPDPSFEDIKKRYDGLRPNAVPGSDFLLAVAANYPEKPEPEDMSRQRQFMHSLAKVYPFDVLRKVFVEYIDKNEVALNSRADYMKWMYKLMVILSKKAHVKIGTYRGYAHHIAYFRSGCSKKTYHGKTCRKAGGGLTKDRDRRKTYRLTHSRLLL